MRLKDEIIFKLAQYRIKFSFGFHYGLNLRYQANVNTNAGNHLMDTFVIHHGG